MPDPKNDHSQSKISTTPDLLSEVMPALANSAHSDRIVGARESPATEAFLSLIEKTHAAASLVEDELEILPLNDALVVAASEWIVSMGYNAPRICEVEDIPGEPYKLLVLGTDENDYLADFARDCASRGQGLVYHPFCMLESDPSVASFDYLTHSHCLSIENLLTGQLDEIWIHERSHGIIDSLKVAGVDHPLHGIFSAKNKSPLFKLPYGDHCSFDEILAFKEELSFLVSQLDQDSGRHVNGLLDKIEKTAYTGAGIAKILTEGVAQRIPECLDNLKALSGDPNSYLKIIASEGTDSRLELGIKAFSFLNISQIDLWDAKNSLLVKISDEKMHSKITFDLVGPKWLNLRHQLWQDITEKNLSLSDVLEHAHFKAITTEVRSRSIELEKMIKRCSKAFIAICKNTRALLDPGQKGSSGILHPGSLKLTILLQIKRLDAALPCPEGVGPT